MCSIGQIPEGRSATVVTTNDVTKGPKSQLHRAVIPPKARSGESEHHYKSASTVITAEATPMRLLRVSVLIAILTAASSGAYASPIHYSEFVSGDTSGLGPLLSLDFGDNTFEGNASYFVDADTDIFRFSVPTGGVLTSLNYAFDTTATGAFAETGWLLFDATPFTVVGHQAINVIGSGSTAFLPGVLPLQPDTYTLHINMIGKTNASTFSTNYTWTLGVASVPDSASTLALMGLAFTGLGFAARWRKL